MAPVVSAGAAGMCRLSEEARERMGGNREKSENPLTLLEIVPMTVESTPSLPPVTLPTDKGLVLKVIPMPA
jgi:hypothetical protein